MASGTIPRIADFANAYALKNGDDLNNITVSGVYYAESYTIAASLSNCPMGTAFVMMTFWLNATTQIQVIFGKNIMYARRHTLSSGWEDWAKWDGVVSSQPTSPSAVYTIANNATLKLKFTPQSRAVVFSSGSSSGRGLYASINCTSTSVASVTVVNTPSGLAASASDDIVSIANTSGSGAYILLMLLTGDLPTAS